MKSHAEATAVKTGVRRAGPHRLGTYGLNQAERQLHRVLEGARKRRGFAGKELPKRQGFHGLVLSLTLAADMIFASHLYLAIAPVLQSIILAFIAVVSFVYAGIALARGYSLVVSLFVVAILLTVFQLWIFSVGQGAEIKVNALFQYVIGCDFVLYYVLAKNGMVENVARRLVIFSTAYLLLYLAMAICFRAGVLPKELISSLILTDDERGDRLYMYGGAATIGWYFWLSRVADRFTLRNFLFAAVCATDFYLCLSRVAELCAIILSALYILRMRRSFISATCLVILGAVSLSYFVGVVDFDWNPFSLFAGDSSGGARAIEYEFSRTYLASHPIFGLGIPSSPLDLAIATGNDYFSSTDLGTIGVWLDFGIVGLLIFFVGSYVSCTFRSYPTLPPYMNDGLFLCGCSIGVYGCLSPGIFYQPAANTSALLLGLWLAAPTQARPHFLQRKRIN